MKLLITKFLFISFSLFALSSCKLSGVSISAMRPADINIADHIQKVSLATRIKPGTTKEKVLNALEGALSGEGLFEDREAAPEAIRGLRDALVQTPRFTCAIVQEELLGTGGSYLPPLLSWDEVNRICAKDSADALITLELFDSDQAKEIKEGSRVIKNKEGKDETIPEFYGKLTMTVTCGWRIYDPSTKTIVDEARNVDSKIFESKGASRRDADLALPNKRNAVDQTGYYSGNKYGIRISPSWITLYRQYYVKGTDNFVLAKRLVRSQNWDGAIETWRKELSNPNKKIAGRAAFNIALGCEVKGKLDDAIDWANKAYVEFGDSRGNAYANQLRDRKADEAVLDQQLKR